MKNNLKNKIYFASDFHLENIDLKKSQAKEKKIITWLNKIKNDAKKIYLLGDIFDFWFEYKYVVPKGHIRMFAKLAQLTEDGTEIHFFTGNHDMWVKNYFFEELGVIIHRKEKIINEHDKKILIGHGDGLGKGDFKYKILKILFSSKLLVWGFSVLPVNFSFKIANLWSSFSRKKQKNNKEQVNILLEFSKNYQKTTKLDYYIFGHHHNPEKIKIDKKSYYINTGDWIKNFSYAVMENGNIELKKVK